MQEPAMKLARVLTECTLSHFPIISITQASPFFLGRSPSIRRLLMGMMATLVQGNTRAVVRAAARSKSLSLVLSRYQPTQYQVSTPHISHLTSHTSHPLNTFLSVQRACLGLPVLPAGSLLWGKLPGSDPP